MGDVVVPVAYLDSNVFVDMMEGGATVAALVRPVFEAAKSGRVAAITSELTLGEVLAPPAPGRGGLSLGDKQRGYYELMVFGGVVQLVPVTRTVIEETPKPRSGCSMRLVDALHLATAVLSNCKFFVSRDSDFAGKIPPEIALVNPTRGLRPLLGASA